jgi:hypothetical protein
MQFDLDTTAIQAVFELPDSDGRFSESQTAYFRALSQRRRMVVLAFPPKAAGTFLRQAVALACGGDLIRTVHAQGGRAAVPYLPTFLLYYHGGVCDGPLVTHIHMQALPANIHFMEAFALKPVVMVRNIPDMLASYWDMLDSDPAALQIGLNGPLPPQWPLLTKEAKADFLIDMLGPWYVGYFATWLDYAARAQGAVLVLRYGDFCREPQAALQQILAHSGFPVTAEECAHVLRETWLLRGQLRFNRGREGRGAAYFTPQHRARLAQKMSCFPVLALRQAELLGPDGG